MELRMPGYAQDARMAGRSHERQMAIAARSSSLSDSQHSMAELWQPGRRQCSRTAGARPEARMGKRKPQALNFLDRFGSVGSTNSPNLAMKRAGHLRPHATRRCCDPVGNSHANSTERYLHENKFPTNVRIQCRMREGKWGPCGNFASNCQSLLAERTMPTSVMGEHVPGSQRAGPLLSQAKARTRGIVEPRASQPIEADK